MLRWEKVLWRMCLVTYFLLDLFADLWNGFSTTFPITDWRPLANATEDFLRLGIHFESLTSFRNEVFFVDAMFFLLWSKCPCSHSNESFVVEILLDYTGCKLFILVTDSRWYCWWLAVEIGRYLCIFISSFSLVEVGSAMLQTFRLLMGTAGLIGCLLLLRCLYYYQIYIYILSVYVITIFIFIYFIINQMFIFLYIYINLILCFFILSLKFIIIFWKMIYIYYYIYD